MNKKIICVLFLALATLPVNAQSKKEMIARHQKQLTQQQGLIDSVLVMQKAMNVRLDSLQNANTATQRTVDSLLQVNRAYKLQVDSLNQRNEELSKKVNLLLSKKQQEANKRKQQLKQAQKTQQQYLKKCANSGKDLGYFLATVRSEWKGLPNDNVIAATLRDTYAQKCRVGRAASIKNILWHSSYAPAESVVSKVTFFSDCVTGGGADIRDIRTVKRTYLKFSVECPNQSKHEAISILLTNKKRHVSRAIHYKNGRRSVDGFSEPND